LLNEFSAGETMPLGLVNSLIRFCRSQHLTLYRWCPELRADEELPNDLSESQMVARARRNLRA
jgi:hypothetical protein